jgi:hypothetical protein
VAAAATVVLIVATSAVFIALYVAREKFKQWLARRMGVDYDPD